MSLRNECNSENERSSRSVLWVGAALLVGCRQEPPVWHIARRVEELLRPSAQRQAVSTAGRASVAADDEIRRVIAQELTLAKATVRVAQTGRESIRAHGLDRFAGTPPTILPGTVLVLDNRRSWL